MAAEAGVAVELDETRLSLRPEIARVCELLCLDPLYLANEGRLLLFFLADQAEGAIEAMRALPEGEGARIIGKVLAAAAGHVTLRTTFGGARLVDMLIGEQRAHIC